MKTVRGFNNQSGFTLIEALIAIAIFSIGLMAVSIDPDLLNFFRDALSLGKASRGRIISLLILSRESDNSSSTSCSMARTLFSRSSVRSICTRVGPPP